MDLEGMDVYYPWNPYFLHFGHCSKIFSWDCLHVRFMTTLELSPQCIHSRMEWRSWESMMPSPSSSLYSALATGVTVRTHTHISKSMWACVGTSGFMQVVMNLGGFLKGYLLNRLPATLTELDSIATFKSKLETFMYARAFDLSDRGVNEGYRL